MLQVRSTKTGKHKSTSQHSNDFVAGATSHAALCYSAKRETLKSGSDSRDQTVELNQICDHVLQRTKVEHHRGKIQDIPYPRPKHGHPQGLGQTQKCLARHNMSAGNSGPVAHSSQIKRCFTASVFFCSFILSLTTVVLENTVSCQSGGRTSPGLKTTSPWNKTLVSATEIQWRRAS